MPEPHVREEYMNTVVRSMVRILSSVVLTVVLPVLAPDALGEEKAKKLDGKTIFNERCLKCHKVEKFRALQHDQKGWEIILSRMERSKSCVLSEDEREAVAGYLSKQYGD
jgi:mono/diheme cytochrome c family protein